ncbi:MAG: hypothetical protein KatS3mg121_1121 [Gammaproteobacteria bacterium]|nr:MAG: hypothetical protein KatS3mg121_1121 [Gammaproteobacteria bacterium]
MKGNPTDPDRRRWLARGLWALGVFACGGVLARRGVARRDALGPPDANGLRLPAGFQSRIVARSGQPVGPRGHRWHAAPDGGAVFAAGDGGWVYVSNSELADGAGGVGALRFDARGALVDAYPILTGSDRNCAGGATPWGTWLSCEEVERGRVFECDPFGRRPAAAVPALGRFLHEAAAVDPRDGCVYLTEDAPDGLLYRWRPARPGPGRPDWARGTLQAARVDDDGRVTWLAVPDPDAAVLPCRRQLPEARRFAGGEGIAWSDGKVYFTTKLDNRVWVLDPAQGRLGVLYDDDAWPDPVLRGVDNVTVSPGRWLYVAEDGDDMQIVALPPDGGPPLAVVQVVGHGGSEVTGPAFSPDGRRLYFSSQRGAGGRSEDGVTYEVRGPFR